MRWLRIILAFFLILSVISFTPSLEAASEVIGVNLIVNNFLNDSTAKALTWLVFNGSKPPPSQVDNVTIKWYDPMGMLAFTDVVDPDIEAVAWSYYHVDQLGEWSVNVTYEGNTSIWNNKSFGVVVDCWGPGVYHVTRTTLVSFNATLTIKPGTAVKFDEDKGLGVEGKLIAQGTGSDPIIFTSNLSTKSPGDWSSITFFERADNLSVLDHIKIEYSREGLTLKGTSPLVSNSTFINNKERAIYAELSHSYIINNHISRGVEGISPWGIYSAGSKLILEENFIQNMSTGLYLLNSNITMNANIMMNDNVVENSDFYGMHVKNSIVNSTNDRFMGNRKGVYIDSKSDTIFENLTIIGGLEGFIASGRSKATLWNSTVEEVEIATFVLSGNSTVVLIDCSFGTTDSNPGVSIGATDGSRLIIKNFLIVEVISYDNGSHLVNVTVRVYDGTTLVHEVYTDSNGFTPPLIVTDRMYRPTLIENITRVHVFQGNLSFQNNNRSVAMNTSHTEIFLGSVHEFNETDTVPPFVVSHYPTDDEVVLNIIITITFSEAMQNITVEENFSISPSVAGTFTWVGNIFIFVPLNLTNNTFYTVIMGTGAKDLANNSLLSPYQFFFTTRDIIDTTPPRILGVSPTGTEVPVDITYINITFSEEMQRFSTEPAFSIEPRIPGIFSWEGTTLRFRPVFELSEMSAYTVTINGSKARDTAGNTLDGNANGIAEGSPTDDYSWQFKTKRHDFTPPVISKGYPTGNMVDLNSAIRIYFSEAMNITSVKEAFSYTNGTVTWTSANGTWGKTVYLMTFIPSQPFNYSQVYLVTVKGSAEDQHTNTLDGNANGIAEGSPIDDFTWSFRTIYDPEIGLPTINEVSPTGTGAGIGTEISINFSQAMNQPSAEEAFTITDGVTTWSKDHGTFIWEGQKCTFIPEFTYEYNTTYTVRINITAKNIVGEQLDGNENGTPEDYTIDAYSWNFTTGGPPELIISYVSVEGAEAKNQTKIWFADAGGVVLIGVNVTNIGYSDLNMSFNVTLHNMSATGQPMNISLGSLKRYQDSGTLIFSWPAPTAIGDHWVEIIVDWGNKIFEVNENNNTFTLHFAVGPDYAPVNVTVNGMDASDPSTVWYVDLGVAVEIGVEAKDIGFSGVASSITYSIAFWNSTSTGVLIGPSPFQLTTGLPGLGAGESSGYQSAFWFVPKGVNGFYISIIIDYDDTTLEIDEGNNNFVLHLAFSPDYTIANVLVDGSEANDPKLLWNATAGQLIPISVNATNIGLSGVADTTQYNISFYNSTNRGTPLEEPFYTARLPGLLSDEDSGEVIGLWLPANKAGSHYVAVIIDPNNELPEGNEENNVFVLNFVIGPDIVPVAIIVNGLKITRSPSLPIYVGPRENVTIEVNATNLGSSGTGNDFYLALYNGSRNGKMREQPYLNLSVSALASYGSPGYYNDSISAFWTASLEHGLSYVVIYTDISGLCDESNEGNNYWVLTFTVSPDIVPNNITVDGLPISSYPNEIVTLMPGESILIGANTFNIGDSSTGILQFSMAFYNSTSLGVNLGPSFAYWDSLGPLEKNGFTSDVYGSWRAPHPNKPTDYYINISVDSGGDVSEDEESNNYYILHIKVDAPDLTFDDLTIEVTGIPVIEYTDPDGTAPPFVSDIPVEVPLGEAVTIGVRVINVGGMDTFEPTNVTFYNVSGVGGAPIDLPFWEASLPIINAGENTLVFAVWPNPMAFGMYHINISIDFNGTLEIFGKILELNELNNTFTLIINVTSIPVTTLHSTVPTLVHNTLIRYINSTTELNFTVVGLNPPFTTYYRIFNMTNGSYATAWINYTDPISGGNFSMIWGEGTYKIEFNSTDGVGAQESMKYRYVVVDDSEPFTSISIGLPRYQNLSFDVWNITSATPITLSAIDNPFGLSIIGVNNASGINNKDKPKSGIFYRIWSNETNSWVGDWAKYTGPFNLLGDDGKYTIYYNSTDNLGHMESMGMITIYLDNTGPETNITVSDPKYPHPIYDWFVTSSTLFILNAFEAVGSGANISTMQYMITFTDGGISSEWMMGNTFDIASSFMQGDGNYTIEYRSKDHLGNIQSVGVLQVYVDDTAPSTHLSIGEPEHREFTTDLYNISDLTVINISAEDGAGCSVSSIEYRIFNAFYDSGWVPYSGEFNLSGLSDGVYTILYNGTDALRNSATFSIEVYLDIEAPTTVLSVGEPKHRSGTYNPWNVTSSTPLFLAVVYENASGLAYMQYRIKNSTYDSDWKLYTGWFNLSSSLHDGIYTVYYRGIDNLGNVEREKNMTVRLDNTGPEALLTIFGPAYRDDLDDIWNISGLSVLYKDADDGNGSGVDAIRHRIYGNDTRFYYTGWLSLPSFNIDLPDGNYTIEFYAIDNLSNAGFVGYLYLYLDNKPPESFMAVGDPKYRLRVTDDWTVAENTPLTLQGEDGFGSGVEEIYYSIWNDTDTLVVSSDIYIGPFNLSGLGGDGRYRIRFWAWDNVNNTEDWNEIKVILDSVSPKILLNAPTGSGNSVMSYIQVIFSEEMDHDSVKYSFSYIDGAQIWDYRHGFFNWNGKTMTFYPYENLSYSTSFTVIINTTASDHVGNKLDGDGDGIYEGLDDIFTWNFLTAEMSDNEPPTVVYVHPSENAQNVAIGEDIEIEFSEIMDEISVEAAFSYTDGERTFNSTNGFFTWVGNKTIFTPSEPFDFDIEYTVTISALASDISGNAMTEGFSWHFTTESDKVSPNVLSHLPSGDVVSVETVITVYFDEPMNRTSVEKAFIIIPYINGSFAWVENSLIFTPVSNLEYNTTYYVYIGVEATDIAGNALGFPYQFSFTTEPDKIPPEVIAYSPSGIEVDINVNITITFNEAMQHLSVEEAFSIEPYAEGNFSWVGNTLIFTPLGLTNSTTYTVTIGEGAKDLAGNALQTQYQFSFTTKKDPYPPYVIEVEPTGIDVPIDSVIRVRFSERMNISSLYGAFRVEPYLAGTFSWENDTLIFRPNGKFAKNTRYNVTIKSSARDVAGNSMAEDYTWNFTTGGGKPITATPFPWDVFFFWLFLAIIVVILILVFYEFYFKRRRRQKEDKAQDVEGKEESEEEELELDTGEDIEDIGEDMEDGLQGDMAEDIGDEIEDGIQGDKVEDMEEEDWMGDFEEIIGEDWEE